MENMQNPIQTPAQQPMDTEIPYNPSPITILYKLFSGFLGGAIGTGSLLIIFTLASSILKPVLTAEAEAEIAPIFLIVFMVMIFVPSLIANLVSNLLMGLSEREKYRRLSTTIFQTFLLNLVIFIFTAPFYLLITNINLGMIAAIAGLQMILSVIASAIILEIISNPKYGLIGVYTAVLGTILGLVINIIIYQITGSEIIVLFAALPVIWTVIGLVNGGLNLIYFQLYKLYGVDFLSSQESFGDDEDAAAAEPITEEEVYEATTEDRSGSDFLDKGEKKE